jgi:hypothetical protein
MAKTVSVPQTANDLVFKCSAVARDGADFPTVWDAVLKGHALVVGPPIQTLDDEDRPLLEIRLINGQRLIYNSMSNEYVVSWVPRRRAF